MVILSAVSIKCLNIPHINTPTNFKCCLKIIIHANQFRQRLLYSEFSVFPQAMACLECSGNRVKIGF